LNDVRTTLASWRQEYNWERPHSSLGYQTPEQFRQSIGYANLEGQERLPHLHSHDDGYGIFPKPNLNRESPVMNG
jgi:putative transposase